VFGALLFPTAFLVAGILKGTLDRFMAISRSVFELYAVQLSRARLFYIFLDNIRTYFLWLSVAGLCGAFLWMNERAEKKQVALLGAMAVTALVSFAAQNKGFGYHLGGLIPVFVMSALGGINIVYNRLDNSTRLRSLREALAIAVFLVMCVGTERRFQHNLLPYLKSQSAVAVDRDGITLQTVSIVSRESAPTSFFFQWGWNYDVGFLSQRLAASQFINTPALALISKDDTRYRTWLDTFDRELSERKPTFILLDLTTLPKQTIVRDQGMQFVQIDASPALAILARHLSENYVIRQEWKDRVLFKRTME
jgi:hypothetical protein